jgi:hypothetical protein
MYIFITFVKIALFTPLMNIVTKDGVVCEFYEEESDIDIGYYQIFPSRLWP